MLKVSDLIKMLQECPQNNVLIIDGITSGGFLIEKFIKRVINNDNGTTKIV